MITILVDLEGAEPVYRQIARQIREAISRGAIAPGATLPTTRRLGADLGLNLNTVARAYRLLEAEGFVAIAERSGCRVLAPGEGETAIAGDRAAIEAELEGLLARWRQSGLDEASLRMRLDRIVARLFAEDGGFRP